jgi:hypothetical protein
MPVERQPHLVPQPVGEDLRRLKVVPAGGRRHAAVVERDAPDAASVAVRVNVASGPDRYVHEFPPRINGDGPRPVPHGRSAGAVVVHVAYEHLFRGRHVDAPTGRITPPIDRRVRARIKMLAVVREAMRQLGRCHPDDNGSSIDRAV